MVRVGLRVRRWVCVLPLTLQGCISRPRPRFTNCNACARVCGVYYTVYAVYAYGVYGGVLVSTCACGTQVSDPRTGVALGMSNTSLVTTNKTAGAGKTMNMLVIGDSLTAGGEHTGVLEAIAGNDTMHLRLIGTRGQSPTNRHEGRGGWTVQDYATAGREGFFFVVRGMAVPPGGPPGSSTPEEKYTVKTPGKPDGACTFWDVNVTSTGSWAGGSGGSLAHSGVIGASCTGYVPQRGVLHHNIDDAATGDANITYSSYTTGSLNPFWTGSMAAGEATACEAISRGHSTPFHTRTRTRTRTRTPCCRVNCVPLTCLMRSCSCML